mgnify:CR=1 FL=1
MVYKSLVRKWVSEEAIYVAELVLKGVVVGVVLGDERRGVLAVVGQLESLLLLELVVAVAGPLHEVLAGLKRRSPSHGEEIVVLQLKRLLHSDLLLHCRGVEVEGAVDEEGVPLLRLLLIIVLDGEALGLRATLEAGVLATLHLLGVGLGGVLLLQVGTLLEHLHELTVEDFVADGSAHLLLKLFFVQHLII